MYAMTQQDRYATTRSTALRRQQARAEAAPSFGGLARPTPRLYGREQACRLEHLEVLHANGCTRQLKLTRAREQTDATDTRGIKECTQEVSSSDATKTHGKRAAGRHHKVQEVQEVQKRGEPGPARRLEAATAVLASIRGAARICARASSLATRN